MNDHESEIHLLLPLCTVPVAHLQKGKTPTFILQSKGMKTTIKVFSSKDNDRINRVKQVHLSLSNALHFIYLSAEMVKHTRKSLPNLLSRKSQEPSRQKII